MTQGEGGLTGVVQAGGGRGARLPSAQKPCPHATPCSPALPRVPLLRPCPLAVTCNKCGTSGERCPSAHPPCFACPAAAPRPRCASHAVPPRAEPRSAPPLADFHYNCAADYAVAAVTKATFNTAANSKNKVGAGWQGDLRHGQASSGFGQHAGAQ